MLEQLLDDLFAFESEAMPVVTATLDLRPGAVGGRPHASTIARRALSEQRSAGDYRSKDASTSLDQDEERLEEAIEAAIADGGQGLMFVGCAGEDFSRSLLLEQPIRNSLRIGRHPWLFELLRFRALYGVSTTVAFVDLHTMDAVRITMGDSEPLATVDYEAHFLSKRRGRTDVHGRSGAVASRGGNFGGAPGGHSKHRIENQVEEHRAMFAREAAEELRKSVDDEDILVIAGVPEARSQLLAQLPASLAERAVEHAAVADAPTAGPDVVRMAMDLAVEEQYGEADRLLAALPPDGVIAGRGPLLSALEEGRVATLVVHEDAVSHMGFSDDARAQGTSEGEQEVERALRMALRTSADIRFSHDQRLLDEHDGLLGVRRW